jgi:primosomal protein N' (replication factor Y)
MSAPGRSLGAVIAKVEPLTPARALRGPFDYRVPAAMSGVEVGTMLLVPFGRRRLVGVVTGLADASDVPAERLVEPLAALDEGVPPELVRLGLWVASEYCSTPARGLALVLPPGTGTGPAPRVRPHSALVASLTPAGQAVADGSAEAALGPRQRAALVALAGGPLGAAGLARRTSCDHSTLRRLERRGLVALAREPQRRRPAGVAVGAGAPAGMVLTAAQEAAVGEIVAALDARGAERRLLLHGVTGSGKTEVYLRAAAAALERGRSAIVLVPEIALTPQTVARFAGRFGDQVAVLHSKLGAGERYDEWMRLRRGEARVCVGPRSAVFAPLADLGLIVIDEEHDPSYKQDGDPRYDARRVAERRAEEAGAVLVAGTATPRPESWLTLRRLEIPARVDGRTLPPVEVVGMRGARSPLHARTHEALDAVRRRGQKAIVLLNRRGWSNFLTCRGCGRVWQCPECDVSLVLHRAAGTIACHHCGHAEPVPGACPDCGSVSLARHGAGTERLEHELEALLAPLPVFRLDSDAAAGRGAVGELLQRFERAPAGVLLGTQMVAKGHDFAEVTLGVVIDADATLRFPDFRSEERTFALVAQLAGRSGRGPRGGSVIVQALDPGARSLRYAARHDAAGFLAEELDRRSALAYPPFAHLVRIVCTSAEPGAALAAAAAVRERIDDAGAAVLGPAPLFRLKGRERAQVVVKGFDRAAAIRSIGRAVEAVAGAREHRGVSFAVDVDPQ